MKKFSPFILIAIAIALFFLFIDPQYGEVQALQKTKADNDTMLGLSQELTDKREDLQNSFNSISSAEKEKLQKLLPNTVDNVRLILDINNIAESKDIVIRNISVSGGEAEEEKENNTKNKNQVKQEFSNEIGIITLSFSMISSYEVFVEFLEALEESLRLVDIKRLTVTPSDGQYMQFTVTLNTYWLR